MGRAGSGGHIADDPQGLGQAPVQQRRFFRASVAEGRRYGAQPGKGTPQLPGGQGKGGQLLIPVCLLQKKIVGIPFPADGGGEGGASQAEGQRQGALLKGGVFFGSRQQKRGDGIANGQGQRLCRRVARNDNLLPDAEAGGGNQMYEVGIGIFHDDPPDTDL